MRRPDWKGCEVHFNGLQIRLIALWRCLQAARHRRVCFLCASRHHLCQQPVPPSAALPHPSRRLALQQAFRLLPQVQLIGELQCLLSVTAHAQHMLRTAHCEILWYFKRAVQNFVSTLQFHSASYCLHKHAAAQLACMPRLS